MTKTEIIEIFAAATKSEKDAITRAAREYLKSRKIEVGRRALDYWRKREMSRSPLAKHYLKAYQHAIQSRQCDPAQQ